MCLPKDLKGVTIQRIVTIVGNMLCLNFGIMFGISPAHMKLYMKEVTPLNRIVNEADVTWISGCLFASAAVGAIICAFVLQSIGSRVILLLSGLLQIASWLCVQFAYDILHICSSRIFGGLAGGAAFTVLPIFIAEISEVQNSSELITSIEQWRTLGILIGFILGQHLQYEYVAIIALCISCAFTMMFPFSQESPYFHMHRRDVPNLEKSLRWFRGVRRMSDRNRPEFLRELNEFKRNLEMQTIPERNISNAYLLKAILCTLMIIVAVQLSGIYVILFWSDEIIGNEVFVNFFTDVSVLSMAVIQFVGATITVCIASAIRRKILLFSSALICGGAMICLALLIHIGLRGQLQWLASGLLLLHVFFANMGMYPLISLIPAEILPVKLVCMEQKGATNASN